MAADCDLKEPLKGEVKFSCTRNGVPIDISEAQKIVSKAFLEMALSKLARLERQSRSKREAGGSRSNAKVTI